MASQDRYPEEQTSRRGRLSMYTMVGLGGLLLCLMSSCQERDYITPQAREASGLTAPDLTGCTHLETHFVQPLIAAFSFRWGRQSVLSTDELAHVQSLERFIVDEPQRVRRIIESIGKARPIIVRQSDGVYAVPALRDVAHVTCYRGASELTSFILKERFAFCTRDGDWFDYDGTGLDLFDFAPQVQGFALRYACASNVRELRDSVQFADPNRWCDVVQHRFSEVNATYLERAMQYFRCPAAGEGRCHYAMNSSYKRDSPPDMVLLFETKAGWNQHGGPELFTFDNHDPKGGLVLLNDGTVKFIRTEEELKQLRWK